jgi:hypothetical protein
MMEGIEHTFNILHEAKFPTRVLDDAFHYMDRLLRLLSKKHSAFKAFAHDFSEAIFIRDKSDELAVRAVLEKNGIDWEYAKRAKAAALNRRIRRYIPSRIVLEKRLQTLFDAYADIQCSTKKARGSFFSDEAKEMVKNLLETVRKGYLSDPPGISLYFLMGKDRDGLNLYRTARGTNSVEGGFHMVVRRVFGSLRASPELAECLLVNWILRRNMEVCFNPITSLYFLMLHRLASIIAQERNTKATLTSGSETGLLNLQLQWARNHPSPFPEYFPRALLPPRPLEYSPLMNPWPEPMISPSSPAPVSLVSLTTVIRLYMS